MRGKPHAPQVHNRAYTGSLCALPLHEQTAILKVHASQEPSRDDSRSPPPRGRRDNVLLTMGRLRIIEDAMIWRFLSSDIQRVDHSRLHSIDKRQPLLKRVYGRIHESRPSSSESRGHVTKRSQREHGVTKGTRVTTGHETERSPQTRRMPSSGTEICQHTCEPRSCVSLATKTLEWNRAGNSLKRHAKTRSKHPNCSPACPQYSNLHGRSTSSTTHSPSPEDCE